MVVWLFCVVSNARWPIFDVFIYVQKFSVNSFTECITCNWCILLRLMVGYCLWAVHSKCVLHDQSTPHILILQFVQISSYHSNANRYWTVWRCYMSTECNVIFLSSSLHTILSGVKCMLQNRLRLNIEHNAYNCLPLVTVAVGRVETSNYRL